MCSPNTSLHWSRAGVFVWRDELIPAMWEEAMHFFSARKMSVFQSSAAFLLWSVSLSCWVGIYTWLPLPSLPSFALSSRQPDTLQLNWAPANDKKSESLRASAAPLAVSSFWIKHIIPITVTVRNLKMWLTCQLLTWAESSPTPSPLSIPTVSLCPLISLFQSLSFSPAPFHPVPQRFGKNTACFWNWWDKTKRRSTDRWSLSSGNFSTDLRPRGMLLLKLQLGHSCSVEFDLWNS